VTSPGGGRRICSGIRGSRPPTPSRTCRGAFASSHHSRFCATTDAMPSIARGSLTAMIPSKTYDKIPFLRASRSRAQISLQNRPNSGTNSTFQHKEWTKQNGRTSALNAHPSLLSMIARISLLSVNRTRVLLRPLGRARTRTMRSRVSRRRTSGARWRTARGMPGGERRFFTMWSSAESDSPPRTSRMDRESIADVISPRSGRESQISTTKTGEEMRTPADVTPPANPMRRRSRGGRPAKSRS
jgi:hypothetical protein